MTTARVQKCSLAVVSIFAFVWAAVRACTQAMTLDETDTYFWFASRSASYIWRAFPNNHVLNTLLIWMTTHLFGVSALTVRMPALLGACLYICTCYFLCRTITNRFSLQLSLLICLLYNPFILDFMVAARGYGLADAFLLAAIAMPVWHRTVGWPSIRACCGLASLALGLSFTANFSYAFVDLAAFVALAIWAIGQRESESLIRVAADCVVPGLFVALVLGGYPLAHWPKGELLFGAHSLAEMKRSLVDASLYKLNPRFLDADVYDILELLKGALLPLLGILCVLQLAATAIDGSWRGQWLGKFAASVIAITISSLAINWLAFRFGNLLLPMSRTGIYFIVLCTVGAGVIAAAPARSAISDWLGKGITAVLIGLAGYYLCCLRLTYFKEYEWDADVKKVYAVLARLNHEYGVNDVASSGGYVSPLNFYRVVSKKETFPEFAYFPQHQLPEDKSIYVVDGPFDRDFIEKEKLAIIYRGDLTAVVIAVRPGGKIPVPLPASH